ncbi:MAG: hypothetical protein LBL61_03120, partial [Elusimicrobiota bacterium]|nr:hypothetical protein [Elusimicrobiota bacterium]
LQIEGKVGWGELEFVNDKMLFKPVGKMIEITPDIINRIALKTYEIGLRKTRKLLPEQLADLLKMNTKEAKTLVLRSFDVYEYTEKAWAELVVKNPGNLFSGAEISKAKAKLQHMQANAVSKTEVKPKVNKVNIDKAAVERLKPLSIPEKVSKILKSPNSKELARAYFDQYGIKEFPAMIASAKEQVELKIADRLKLPPTFIKKAYPVLTKALAESMLGKPAELNRYLEKYPVAERAAARANIEKQLKEGKISEDFAKKLFPKAAQTLKKAGFWEQIKGKAGKGGGVFGIAMLVFIIGTELAGGKASANITGLETRLALAEIVGSEYGPAFAGAFCEQNPGIMTSIIGSYGGDKEQLKDGLMEYLGMQIDLLKSEDIMNEPVVKAAMEEWRKRQTEEKKQELQKALQNNNEKLEALKARYGMFKSHSRP